MVFQIHWQNRDQPEVTEFLAQGDTDEIETKLQMNPHEWIRQQLEKRRDECPEGWQPLVIWGDHPSMMVAPAGASEHAD